MSRYHIETRETALGFGVFSTILRETHELIGEIRGEIYDDGEYESDYCVDLGNEARLEPQAPFRFINHSCDPNCELMLWKTRRKHGVKYSRLWLQTVRAVYPGEELTIDYAWPAESAIPCKCRSRHCRGWIVHPAEVDAMLLEVGGL